MIREKYVSRKTLARYAGLLGTRSLAYECLQEFDRRRAAGEKVKIRMVNSGFYLETVEGARRYA